MRPWGSVRRSRAGPVGGDVEAALRAEGLTPHAWGNGAGDSYASHAAPAPQGARLRAGIIVFHTDAGDLALEAGDRMELPRGVEHGATVGAAGVECVEAYRP